MMPKRSRIRRAVIGLMDALGATIIPEVVEDLTAALSEAHQEQVDRCTEAAAAISMNLNGEEQASAWTLTLYEIACALQERELSEERKCVK